MEALKSWPIAQTNADSLTWTNNTLVPPLGVAIMAGCGADLLINVLLTIWLYVP
jgi:uncharacterized membrane protein YqaE (UPF0057 family)